MIHVHDVLATIERRMRSQAARLDAETADSRRSRHRAALDELRTLKYEIECMIEDALDAAEQADPGPRGLAGNRYPVST